MYVDCMKCYLTVLSIEEERRKKFCRTGTRYWYMHSLYSTVDRGIFAIKNFSPVV